MLGAIHELPAVSDIFIRCHLNGYGNVSVKYYEVKTLPSCLNW